MADSATDVSSLAPPSASASGAGGNLFQGSTLPMVTSVGTAQQGVPSFYLNYINDLANTANTAGQNAQFAGASPLQQQAFDMAPQAVGAWKPTMGMATGYLGQVGNYDPTTAGAGALNSALGQNAMTAANPYLNSAANPTYNTVNQYMSPYVNDVVGKIGDLAQQNIMNSVAPQTTAGIVGAGQFGSQRGAQALGQTLGQYGQQTTAQQLGALNTGYQNAMTQAQNQAQLYGQLGQTAGNLTNTMQANQANIGQIQGNQASQAQQNFTNAAATGGNLASQTGALSWNDVNNMANLGSQQQQIAQAAQLFPLTVGNQQAQMLRGFTMPTSTATTQTQPAQAGQMGNSTLSNIAGLTGLLASPDWSQIGQNLGITQPAANSNQLILLDPSQPQSSSNPPVGYYNSNGQPVLSGKTS